MNELFYGVIQWIKEDWKSSPLRCFFEIIAWALSVGCSITMAITVPNPPFLILYPLFITQCAIFAWAAWTRKSLGMLSNYALLVTIDTIALYRML